MISSARRVEDARASSIHARELIPRSQALPALVLSAYWKEAQASRKASPNCCAKVRATRRRKTSPARRGHTILRVTLADASANGRRASCYTNKYASCKVFTVRPMLGF